MERDALEEDINHRYFEGTDYFCTVEHISSRGTKKNQLRRARRRKAYIIMDTECKFDDKYGTILLNSEPINKFTNIDDMSILFVNIRGLQTNLEIFIQNFENKPDIIVCAETGFLPHHKLYNLKDYNYDMYYNHSYINKSDGKN